MIRLGSSAVDLKSVCLEKCRRTSNQPMARVDRGPLKQRGLLEETLGSFGDSEFGRERRGIGVRRMIFPAAQRGESKHMVSPVGSSIKNALRVGWPVGGVKGGAIARVTVPTISEWTSSKTAFNVHVISTRRILKSTRHGSRETNVR